MILYLSLFFFSVFVRYYKQLYTDQRSLTVQKNYIKVSLDCERVHHQKDDFSVYKTLFRMGNRGARNQAYPGGNPNLSQ
jgi:hypothetical protein